MKIVINGTEMDIKGVKTISELVKTMNFDNKPLAVEYNGAVLKSAHLETTLLKNGDKIEIVTFVGGG
ncbi:MAG: sulfur carrier protein ThiS [Planctomycetes bacterium]|nr:sulfur carrier protein ThiS [Planctomycetota bacterium]